MIRTRRAPHILSPLSWCQVCMHWNSPKTGSRRDSNVAASLFTQFLFYNIRSTSLVSHLIKVALVAGCLFYSRIESQVALMASFQNHWQLFLMNLQVGLFWHLESQRLPFRKYSCVSSGAGALLSTRGFTRYYHWLFWTTYYTLAKDVWGKTGYNHSDFYLAPWVSCP